jgi:hypothetical protein
MRRFTPGDIEKLKLMASCGHDGRSIARALGREPLAIRKKAVAMGLSLRKPSTEFRRVRLPLPVWQALAEHAAAQNTTVQKVAALLLSTIAKDKLYAAVLDDEPRPVRRKIDTRDSVWTALRKPQPKPPAPMLMPQPMLCGCVDLVQFVPTSQQAGASPRV